MLKLLRGIAWSVIHSFYYTINLIVFKIHSVSYSTFKVLGIVYIYNKGVIKIGDNFDAHSGKNKNPIGGDTILRLFTKSKNATIKIGNNVGISNSTIVCWDSVEIGNNVLIGGSTKIWDTNFHSLNIEHRFDVDGKHVKTAPVYIRDNVFIGGNVIILKGVTIGENSIIGAGSVVTKSIPPNVIAGGNPCVVIRSINP